ncbi:hypothetical protein H2200_009285 [Cladophialophora chaetospira]|uniref:Carbohydrate kinase PfkB domain-containing protein n=1 Tax=Cladophialophora chaetospira TaxID=386627 RepID=A0AA39CFG6_9EURO|nr:hypothetical protein H2200_009285 [Cladophialophora chaetospira]
MAQTIPLLTTLGLMVIDEIEDPSTNEVKEVLGGSGAWCSVGACMFLPKTKAKSICWKFQIGGDLSSEMEKQIIGWGINAEIEQMKGNETCRTKIKDKTGDSALAEYIRPKLAVEPHHLRGSIMLKAQCFHLVTPLDVLGQEVRDLIQLRQEVGMDRPLIIWAPPSLTCHVRNLNCCMNAVRHVDVFSPNHIELLRLFGREPSFDRNEIETLAGRFLDEGVGPTGNGSVVSRWLPAYYDSEHNNRPVVDTTGAGNAFLGGFIAGWVKTGDAVEAAAYGNVASSFALEQVGPPVATGLDGELWNGVCPRARLQEYRVRMGGSEQAVSA